MGKYGKIIGNHGKIMGKYTIYMEELLKRCHKPPMTGNGKHTTYKNGDDWVMIYYCFTHIITHGFEWYVNYPVTKKNWMRCNNISDMSLRYVDGIDWTIHCCSSQGNLSLSRAIGQQLRWLRFQHPETLSFFHIPRLFFFVINLGNVIFQHFSNLFNMSSLMLLLYYCCGTKMLRHTGKLSCTLPWWSVVTVAGDLQYKCHRQLPPVP